MASTTERGGTTGSLEGSAALWAVSPLDGRYALHLAGLGDLVSEGALIGLRAYVEAQWLLHLAEVPALGIKLSPSTRESLMGVTLGGRPTWTLRVKELEAKTNHDVKAVEYYLQERIRAAGAQDNEVSWLHFACTSEDINNLSYGLMQQTVRERRLLPLLDQVTADLAGKAREWAATPMLSRTHGQTASPTTLGKEIAVFGRRLERQRQMFAALAIEGKINGAVGNYNAHRAAFPEVPWEDVARGFVEGRLKLTLNPLTTQIENHDSLVEYAQGLAHINSIMIGLARDIWGYVSLGYFRQLSAAGEVGSSTMPHKINPIDFENAEGNLGVAVALSRHFAEKLPISRWQRDLSDSTVLRSLGSVVGYSELAWRSLLKGLGKIVPEPARMIGDLDQAWEVLAEPVQTVMRRYGVADAYERLKAATRGQAVTKAGLHALIDATQELPEAARAALKAMTPASYVGDGERLARAFADDSAKAALARAKGKR